MKVWYRSRKAYALNKDFFAVLTFPIFLQFAYGKSQFFVLYLCHLNFPEFFDKVFVEVPLIFRKDVQFERREFKSFENFNLDLG